MSVTVTNCTVLTETLKEITYGAATADVDGTDEDFLITPTKRNGSICIVLTGTGSGADGNITVKVSEGAMAGAKGDLTVTLTKNKTMLLWIETARYISNSGVITVNLDPAATDKLLTDHAAQVGLIELP